jgi:hypothetical protein
LFATKVEKMPGARKRSGDPVIARDRLIGKTRNPHLGDAEKQTREIAVIADIARDRKNLPRRRGAMQDQSPVYHSEHCVRIGKKISAARRDYNL